MRACVCMCTVCAYTYIHIHMRVCVNSTMEEPLPLAIQPPEPTGICAPLLATGTIPAACPTAPKHRLRMLLRQCFLIHQELLITMVVGLQHIIAHVLLVENKTIASLLCHTLVLPTATLLVFLDLVTHRVSPVQANVVVERLVQAV